MDRGVGQQRGRAAPVDVLEAAISNVLGAEDAAAVPANVPTFIPSKTFQSAKPGYLFSTSNGGGQRIYNQTSLPSNRPSSSEMLLLMNRKLIFECPAPFISASSWIIMD